MWLVRLKDIVFRFPVSRHLRTKMPTEEMDKLKIVAFRPARR